MQSIVTDGLMQVLPDLWPGSLYQLGLGPGGKLLGLSLDRGLCSSSSRYYN